VVALGLAAFAVCRLAWDSRVGAPSDTERGASGAGQRLPERASDVWVFFATAVLGAPALFLLRKPPVLYERYLFIPWLFFLVLMGVTAGAIWRGPPGPRLAWRRRLLLCAVVLYLLANATLVLNYSKAGRGQFRQALAYIAAASGDGPITLVGDVDVDKDFRARTYVRFYAPLIMKRPVDYRQDGPVDWVILHRLEAWLDQRPSPPGELTYQGSVYRLAWASPPEGPAWGWYVYRRR
jgi:hypothetical protein